MLLLAACTAPDPTGRPRPVDPGTTSVPPVVAVTVEDLPLSVHGKRFAITLDRAAVPVLECTYEGDVTEVHEVGGTAATEQVLEVHGLLADAVYTCVVEADGGRWEGTVETDPADPGLPELSVLVDRGDRDGAYTLFDHWVNGPQDLDRVLVVDPDGRVRWSFTLDEPTLSDVDFRWVPEEAAFLVGGGSGYAPRYVALDGTTGWIAPGPEGSGWYHHHTERLPDGTVLSLATEWGEWGGEAYEGVQIETRDPATDEVGWEWHGHDALVAGDLPAPAGPGDEPWHANAVAFADDGYGPAAYVSFKWLDRWVRVDRETGEIGWQLGRGGDFALLDELGLPLGDEEWFYGQHDPEWDPVTGRLLLYDNGSGRPGGGIPNSRVLELELDVPARTATRRWAWTEPGWYEPLYGDADRLPSGHVLVAMGSCACVASAPPHRSAIVEVDPADDGVVWRLELGDDRDGLYRAERVDGCALFANRKYCP